MKRRIMTTCSIFLGSLTLTAAAAAEEAGGSFLDSVAKVNDAVTFSPTITVSGNFSDMILIGTSIPAGTRTDT